MISILLVDDEPDLLDIARIYLEEQRGFRIDCVTSPKMALRRMQETSFDVIVSDYQMPEMDGIEFLKKLRGKKNYRPFIIFTGRGREEIAIEALNAGADFYLQKGGDPIAQFAELSHIIRKVVRQHRAEKALEESDERYRRIIDGLTDYLYTVRVKDGKAITTTHSAACFVVTGYTAEEFATDPYLWIRMIFPDDQNRVISHFSGVLSGNHVPPVEHRIVRKDGQVRWVRDTPVLQRDPYGNLVSYDGVIKDITERRQAEERLQHLTEFQESVITNARVWLSVLDRKGKILVWNTAAEEISGYLSTEIIGRNEIWKRLYPKKEYRKKVTDTITRIISDKKYLENFETTIRSKQGKQKVISWNTRGIPNSTGTISDYIAIGVDVTDRKQAEDALRVHAEIERNMSEAVYLIRVSDAMIVYTNRSFEHILGYDPGELICKHVSIINAPVEKTPEEIASGIINSLAQTGSWSGEVLNLRKDGTTVWCHANVITFEHPRYGKVWLSMHRDITERKLAEMEIQNSRKLLQTVIDHSQYHIYAKDLEGRFVLASQSLADFFGHSHDQLLGKKSHDFLPKVIADQHRANDLEVMAQQSLIRIEETAQTQDGLRTFLTTKFPLSDTGGKIYAVCGASVDITDCKRVEEALKLANKKLNLLSSVTRHDINNQMMALCGYTTLLEKQQPDSSYAEYCQKINASAERITAIIQFTKTFESIGVNAAVWQDVGTIVNAASKDLLFGNVRLINEIPAGTEIFTEPLIVKVFYNLMENAIRHGGAITTIRFTSEERNGNRLIICENDGMSVPADEKEKIFERGYGKNTGLGLFLAREILDITGTTIREGGEPGKGARFEMTVPKGVWRTVEEVREGVGSYGVRCS